MNQTPYWLQRLILCSFLVLASTPAQAQVTPDNTLGAESSSITPNVPINGANAERIDGGAQRGSNLFHSFSQFNISDGQRAYFANPSGVENILTRVTGGQVSNILGTLGVDGAANLFLLNPNGIIFGQNARLDVRGSFVGTTANAIGFGEQGFFSATDPSAPPLLTVNPSALLFTQLNSGEITNRARPQYAELGSRYFVGGNVMFDGGVAFVVGNRLELGGLAGEGTVGLSGSGNELQLNFPSGVPRADVVLQNNAAAFASQGGAITVQARNLNVSGESYISTNLNAGEGSPDSPAGDVVINATGAITVDGKSSIASVGFENSLGDSGNVTIDAQSIRLNTSQIYTSSEKNRGSIRLNATSDVTLDGNSLINTFGSPTSTGNSGDITVNARNISLSNSSAINSGSKGKGRSGKTTLQATDAIAFSGGSNISSNSFASAFGGTNSEASGDIEIAARSLFLDGQGTYISANNFDAGRAGDIRITTDDSISLNESAYITAATSGQGDGGNIQLTTRSLTLSNGSYIGVSPSGQGNSGSLLVNASDSVTLSGTSVLNLPDGESLITGSSLSTAAQGSGNSGQLTINTGRLSIQDGGYVITRTSPESGRGGDLTINASDLVEVVGTDPNSVSSRIDTSTFGTGDAGDVTINTGRLSIRDGASVSTATIEGSTGQGGDLTVSASDSVEILGASPDDSFNSALSAVSTDSGNAGRISIDTRRLSLGNGAFINASTGGSGRGGDININATDSVEISANPADIDTADGIFTSTVGSGNAGDLNIRTQRLSVRNGGSVSAAAQPDSTGKSGNIKIDASEGVEVVGISNDGRLPSFISVRSRGEGVAGNITVNSPRISIQDRGAVIAESNTVDGGNIDLNADNLLLRRNSKISATAGLNQGAGNGGNVTIDADLIIAVPNENSDITANAFRGRGGNVQISTQGIFGIQPREQLTALSDITASSELGVQGQLNITEPNVQPEQGLVELPEQVLDTSDQIAQTCPNSATASRSLGEFVVTGRGSLPPNPLEPLAGTTSQIQLATLDGEGSSDIANASSTPAVPPTPTKIVEAQGWVRTANGKVTLVAAAPEATPSVTTTAASCPVSR